MGQFYALAFAANVAAKSAFVFFSSAISFLRACAPSDSTLWILYGLIFIIITKWFYGVFVKGKIKNHPPHLLCTPQL